MNPIELQFLNHTLIYLAMLVGVANVGLLIGLTHFYKESYKEIPSKFTIGLLYFSIILLIGNVFVLLVLIFSLVFALEINEYSGILVYSALFLINVAQVIAFSILFKITWD